MKQSKMQPLEVTVTFFAKILDYYTFGYKEPILSLSIPLVPDLRVTGFCLSLDPDSHRAKARFTPYRSPVFLK